MKWSLICFNIPFSTRSCFICWLRERIKISSDEEFWQLSAENSFCVLFSLCLLLLTATNAMDNIFLPFFCELFLLAALRLLFLFFCWFSANRGIMKMQELNKGADRINLWWGLNGGFTHNLRTHASTTFTLRGEGFEGLQKREFSQR